MSQGPSQSNLRKRGENILSTLSCHFHHPILEQEIILTMRKRKTSMSPPVGRERIGDLVRSFAVGNANLVTIVNFYMLDPWKAKRVLRLLLTPHRLTQLRNSK
jgi:histidinol phosphatase-like enzyme